MKRFNDIRIRTKLGLSFGLILLIVAGLGQFSTLQLARLNTVTVDIATSWLPSVKWLGSLRGDCNEYRRFDMNVLLSETAERKRYWVTRNEETLTRIKFDESKYEPLINSPEGKRIYEDFRARFDNYVDIHKRLVDLMLANKSKQARELSTKEALVEFNATMDILQKGIDLNDRGAQDAAVRSSATYSSSRYSIISIVVAAVITGLLMAFFVSRAITQPLSQVVERFKDI